MVSRVCEVYSTPRLPLRSSPYLPLHFLGELPPSSPQVRGGWRKQDGSSSGGSGGRRWGRRRGGGRWSVRCVLRHHDCLHASGRGCGATAPADPHHLQGPVRYVSGPSVCREALHQSRPGSHGGGLVPLLHRPTHIHTQIVMASCTAFGTALGYMCIFVPCLVLPL